jgi:hypothetical protein
LSDAVPFLMAKMIRSFHHWIPAEETIFLIMDNAGGHGTNDAIEQYFSDLWLPQGKNYP